MLIIRYLLLAAAGWGIGILINYLADVLPQKSGFTAPHCLQCKKQLSWKNYLLPPRGCQDCGKRRSLRTYIVELASIIVSILLWESPPSGLGFYASLAILGYLGVVTIIDLEHRLILHTVSLAGACLGLLIGIWLHGLKATVLGGLAGFIMMLFFYFLGAAFVKVVERYRGSINEDALGFGDVNLSGVVGLLLGWPGITVGIVLTVFLAGAISVLYLLVLAGLRKFRPYQVMPFGPFLVVSTIALLFFKEQLLAFSIW